jgi:small GTP-binding protein
MPSLVEALSDWMSRAQLVARGHEGTLRAAKRALGEGNASEALHLARELRDALPRSAVVLALHADAATAMHLSEEALDAVEELSNLVPYRGDVWLSRAGLERDLGRDPRESLERAVEIADPPAAADAARVLLCDLDLAVGDGERAERWLNQLTVSTAINADVTIRRVRARLLLGDRDAARRLAKDLSLPATEDGPGWLLRAGLLDADDPQADVALRRAVLLDAPGAEALAQTRLLALPDAERSKWWELIADLGRAQAPGWQLAFARCAGGEGVSEQIAKLARGTVEPGTLVELADAAAVARDAHALLSVVDASQSAGVALPAQLGTLATALRLTGAARLDALQGLDSGWASALRAEVVSGWFMRGEIAAWDDVLSSTAELAESLVALDATRRIIAIGRELEGPLRVAVVGEFNAGKSSFVNALLGEPVAATGVLPTTATLHRLVWSPDRIARIERTDGEPARVVPFAELQATLREIPVQAVGEVLLMAPLELLKRVELVDTPGFNAPNSHHARAATRALSEAHVALWLLDASQALKESERERLQTIAELGVPLVVLLNKADRLDAEQTAEAVAYVTQGLQTAGLTSEGPVLAFSALLAKPDPPDPDAYARSGFADVRARLDDLLGSRGRELKDRVLRARFWRVVAALERVADKRQQAVADELRARRAEQEALQALTDRAAAFPKEWLQGLVRTIEQWLPELQAIARPEKGAPGDAASDRFVGSRARALLRDPLLRTLFAVAQVAEVSEAAHAELRSGFGAALHALGPELARAGAGAPAERLATVCVEVVRDLGIGRALATLRRPNWLLHLEALTAVMGPGDSEWESE